MSDSKIEVNNLKLENVNKVYSTGVQAVFDFSLETKPSEFIVLVGPSGCGKSTTLRMIAGLESTTTGKIEIYGSDVTNTEAKNRGISMVFQNYALYPQMTVKQNIEFALKSKKIKFIKEDGTEETRKFSSDEIDEKINWSSSILGLRDYLNRKPAALSGGQRQRVAIARAMVLSPKVFLLDEPLSNLDAKLRASTRSEIKDLHKKLNVVTVYVTHDQIEAMAMADRIVIMNQGFVYQIGEPAEIYNHPANIFSAGFIGTPAMNFIKAKISGSDSKAIVSKQVSFLPSKEVKDAIKKANTEEVTLGIRPQEINISPTGKITAKITGSELLGSEIIYSVCIDDEVNLKLTSPESISSFKIGDSVKLNFDLEKIHWFDSITEQNLDQTKINEETKRAVEKFTNSKDKVLQRYFINQGEKYFAGSKSKRLFQRLIIPPIDKELRLRKYLAKYSAKVMLGDIAKKLNQAPRVQEVGQKMRAEFSEKTKLLIEELRTAEANFKKLMDTKPTKNNKPNWRQQILNRRQAGLERLMKAYEKYIRIIEA